MRIYITTGLILISFPWKIVGQEEHHKVGSDTIHLSLIDAWAKTEEYSRKVQMKELEVDIHAEEISDLRMERYPELAINASAEKATNMPIYDSGLFRKPTQHEIIHNIYKVSADFYLNIYNGNKLNLKIKENKFLHQLSIIEKNETLARLKYETTALYLDIDKSYVFENLVEQDILNQEKQLEEIKSFYKHGAILNNDVFRIELELSKRKMLLIQIQNDILIAAQKLNIIIGENDDTVIIPEHLNKIENQTLTYQDYLNIALENSFEYNISEKHTKLSELNIRQVKANDRPTIALYGEYYYSNPQIFLFPYNPYWYSLGIAGLKMSIPISSVYHNLHKKRSAVLEFEKEEIMHHDTEDYVRQKVKEAYLRYTEALLQIAVSKVNVKQAIENGRIIKDAYFNQTTLVTSLIDSDIQVLQTQFELETARIVAETKYYHLLYTIGTI